MHLTCARFYSCLVEQQIAVHNHMPPDNEFVDLHLTCELVVVAAGWC